MNRPLPLPLIIYQHSPLYSKFQAKTCWKFVQIHLPSSPTCPLPIPLLHAASDPNTRSGEEYWEVFLAKLEKTHSQVKYPLLHVFANSRKLPLPKHPTKALCITQVFIGFRKLKIEPHQSSGLSSIQSRIMAKLQPKQHRDSFKSHLAASAHAPSPSPSAPKRLGGEESMSASLLAVFHSGEIENV